jgi:hypothetical protein
MSIFAYFFAGNLLLEMGWPRKLGILKGEGYEAWIVDAAFAQAMDWGAALGAERPLLALQMMAEIHQGDWEGDDAPNLKHLVESLRGTTWGTATSPREAVPPGAFAKHFKTLSVKEFLDRRTATAMEPRMFHALLWGLTYPDRFEAWYSSELAQNESMLPEMREAGLEVDEPRSLPQFAEDSEEIVRDYEREVSPLPSIPPRLLADAKALGWRV